MSNCMEVDEQLIWTAMDAFASDRDAHGWPHGGAVVQENDGLEYVALCGGRQKRKAREGGRMTVTVVCDTNVILAVYQVVREPSSVRMARLHPQDWPTVVKEVNAPSA